MKKWPAYLIATSSCFLFVLCYTQWVGCEGGLMQRQEPRTTFQPLTNLQPSPRSWHPFISSSPASIQARLSTWYLHFVCWHQCHFNSYPRLFSALNLERACWSVSPEIKKDVKSRVWHSERCWHEQMPEYVCIKVLDERMSNILTNECPDIFVQTNLTQTNALHCIEMSELKPSLL